MTTIFDVPPRSVEALLRNNEVTIALYGLGRIGLPLSVAWLQAGAKVIGVDVNQEVVDSINRGIAHIEDEPGVSKAVGEFVKRGRFRASSDLIESTTASDVSIILVPTEAREGKADLSTFKRATKGIGRGLKENHVVVVESSVPPFTTEQIVRPILEKENGLLAGSDFGLAASPERVMSGRVLQDLATYPKIVGGIDPKSTKIVSSLYKCVCSQVIEVRDAATAEATKIFEGIYRDINIALANELAVFCDVAGLDFQEIRRAANTQPYCELHRPGCGVGGYCIPYYPYFLMDISERRGVRLPLTETGRAVNEAMPTYTISLLRQGLLSIGKEIRKQKITLLGATFRGNTTQCTNSSTKDIVDGLLELDAEISIYDPLASKDEIEREIGIPPADSMREALSGASGVIFQSDHDQFKKIRLEELIEVTEKPLVVVDGRNVLDPGRKPKGILYLGIGRANADERRLDKDFLVTPFTAKEKDRTV